MCLYVYGCILPCHVSPCTLSVNLFVWKLKKSITKITYLYRNTSGPGQSVLVRVGSWAVRVGSVVIRGYPWSSVGILVESLLGPGPSLLVRAHPCWVRGHPCWVRGYPCWVRAGPWLILGAAVALPWWSLLIRVGSLFCRVDPGEDVFFDRRGTV